MFSGTNLLTRCHNASCLFSSIFGSKRQKINILEIGRDKSQSQYFTVGNTKPEYETEEIHQGATPPGRAGGSTPRLGGAAALATPCLASSPIKTPRCLNPKYLINIPRNHL